MAIPINEDPYHHAPIIWPSREDLDQPPPPTYRPRSLDDIIVKTKFSKREIQMIYRSFKQLCPSGIITKSTFQEIYAQFFPHGNTKRYSELVFRTLDRDTNGHITFEEFVMGLSAMTRGSTEEKLGWVFSLYDIHQRGMIGQQELSLVTLSMYDLLSKQIHSTPKREDIHAHAQHAFEKLQRLTGNGSKPFISRSEFVEACLQDEDLRCSIELFDTKL
uniref:EF-hand domain-containing protein n=1 Tax=Bursaphelenchus xylophilus TaxID=6326 RepID=A0A1I7STT3_BURXY